MIFTFDPSMTEKERLATVTSMLDASLTLLMSVSDAKSYHSLLAAKSKVDKFLNDKFNYNATTCQNN